MQTRTLYRGAYQGELNEPDTPAAEPADPYAEDQSNTPEADPTGDLPWKKRYGDLRTHLNTKDERIKALETQLQAASQKEVKIPSTKEELELFAQKYPDVFRHIRSIAMAELLQQKGTLVSETETVKQDLEKVQRELGYTKILAAHKDFEDLNHSQEFNDWAQKQPQQIQDWLFESTDPNLCIKAIDLFKAETAYKAKPKEPTKPRQGADTLVNTRTRTEVATEGGNKKIWKASEIQKMHPKYFEKHEEEIELARAEGRLDMNA